MDNQSVEYKIKYNLSNKDIEAYPEINLEEILYIKKCAELLHTIPVRDLKTIFRLDSSGYSTPMEYNAGISYTITIKI